MIVVLRKFHAQCSFILGLQAYVKEIDLVLQLLVIFTPLIRYKHGKAIVKAISAINILSGFAVCAFPQAFRSLLGTKATESIAIASEPVLLELTRTFGMLRVYLGIFMAGLLLSGSF